MTEGSTLDTVAAVSVGRTKIYVIATIVVATLAVLAIVLLAVLRPDNTATGTLIIGILMPVLTAFLAAAIGQLGVAVDGRLTQTIVEVREASKREGKLEGKLEVIAPPLPGGQRITDPPKLPPQETP